MVKRAIVVISFAALCSTAVAANKQTANEYSYLDLSAQVVNFDDEIAIPVRGGSEIYDGALGGGAKLSFQPFAFGFGFIEGIGFYNEGSSSDFSATLFDIGLGTAYPLTSALDVIGTVALTRQEIEFCSSGFCATAEADGPVIGAGIRLKINERFDILAKYEREDLDIEVAGSPADNETYNVAILEFRAGGERHGLIGGFESNDGDQTFKLGYRLNY
ncbi:outer membrane protein with beta-barrel domain [Marinobacter sp. LV10R520-4]|uniref:outer membrane beta-barrel protein n=1 Tax=Marinobacter sp. LV10R520-4 TaxID=1761796 RepID=UPI000BF24E9B|nr:outer membrane beta-barrel protein [Marinobacter sp. LV10R520-4]PFG54561.1 outer membrane protein with beta-barrel domain [Marinobacter sp. LV10R520-4]